MEKYKLVCLTEYAYRHLSPNDIEALEAMIGSIIYESDNVAEVDSGRLFVMPDGQETHADFIIISKITPFKQFKKGKDETNTF